MTAYSSTLGGRTVRFLSLKDLMAKASPKRSGDTLAGIAAKDDEERVLAQMALSEVPLKAFLSEALIPYEEDEVTRLIVDGHDAAAFAPVAHLTVGDFRNWLLSDAADEAALAALAPGLTPEMAAAVSKIMRVQETDSVAAVLALIHMLDAIIAKYEIPAQSCVLTHVTTTIEAIDRGAPVDLVFQSIAGTEAANAGFGINLRVLEEARDAARSLKRGSVGDNVMYFETGQGSALSANAHHGVDQQTCEARAYAVARKFEPLLVNTVVGFIGPEYLYDGKQIVRAGLEDHFCGKLLGVPMGCDVCYTNHAEADQNDMDALLTLLAVAGVTYIMGVPGSDDIMLNYQTTSFHDALYARRVLGLLPAPEFEAWLQKLGVFERGEALRLSEALPRPFQRALSFFA